MASTSKISAITRRKRQQLRQDTTAVRQDGEDLRKRNWKWSASQFRSPEVSWIGSLPPPPEDELSPPDYFKVTFDQSIISNICAETYKYALQEFGRTTDFL